MEVIEVPAIADAIALLREGPAQIDKRLKRTFWVLVAVAALFTADLVATGAVVNATGVNLPNIVQLTLSTNLVVLANTVTSTPWEIFVPLALARTLLGAPFHYWLGQDVAFMASKKSKGVSKLVSRLETANQRAILIIIFVMKFVPKPPPPFSLLMSFADPYPYAGAAKVPLRWVLLVDALASVIYLSLLFLYGPAFADIVLSSF